MDNFEEESLDDRLRNIASIYNIQIIKDSTLKNESSGGGNQIIQGDYDLEDNKVMDFFHELVLIKIDKFYPYIEFSRYRQVIKNESFSILSYEGLIWEIAFNLASSYGFEWNLGHSVYRHCYKRLLRFVLNEFDNYLIDDESISILKSILQN